MRFILLPALAISVAACAKDDDTPPSVEYLTEAILIPSCAPAQCHSTFAQAEDLSFSTIEESRDAIIDLVAGAVDETDAGTPENAQLYQVLVRTVDRMPFDQPLPNADIALIREFIKGGAQHAQCRPSDGARQCLGDQVATCGDDFNFQPPFEDCKARIASPGMQWRCISAECVEIEVQP
ncbi:MAG TPA: hypothetical protein VM513_30980 [Kofleriaceae bacterium]|jgi:hypothetical protein|nr:hypothetical protein [Kofleriaceae bacterium]